MSLPTFKISFRYRFKIEWLLKNLKYQYAKLKVVIKLLLRNEFCMTFKL